MKAIRVSPKAIIIRNGRLLALKMRDRQGVWYMLPGGGQRHGETVHEALKREVREEVGTEVEVGKLCFVRDYIARNHEFADEEGDAHQIELMFLCRIADGADIGEGAQPDKGQLGLEWLPVAGLEEHRLYPKILRPLIKDIGNQSVPVYLGDVN